MSKTSKYPPLNKIKGRITELGKTYKIVSDETGIPISRLSNKLNGHSLVDIKEVELISKALNIKPEEIAIFFLPNHCETQQKDIA